MPDDDFDFTVPQDATDQPRYALFRALMLLIDEGDMDNADVIHNLLKETDRAIDIIR